MQINSMQPIVNGIPAPSNMSKRGIYIYLKALHEFTTKQCARFDLTDCYDLFPNIDEDYEQWYKHSHDADEHPYDAMRIDLYNLLARAAMCGTLPRLELDHACDLEIVRNVHGEGVAHCAYCKLPPVPEDLFRYIMGSRSVFHMYRTLDYLEPVLRRIPEFADKLAYNFRCTCNVICPTDRVALEANIDLFRDVVDQLCDVLPRAALRAISSLALAHGDDYIADYPKADDLFGE